MFLRGTVVVDSRLREYVVWSCSLGMAHLIPSVEHQDYVDAAQAGESPPNEVYVRALHHNSAGGFDMFLLPEMRRHIRLDAVQPIGSLPAISLKRIEGDIADQKRIAAAVVAPAGSTFDPGAVRAAKWMAQVNRRRRARMSDQEVAAA